MKQKHIVQKWIPAVVAGLALTGSTAMAQFTIASFDTDISAVNGTGGSAAPTTAFAATGNPGGSLYVTVPWQNKTGWQDCQLSFNQNIDLSTYINFEFDIKVDIANSTITDSGDYGGFQTIAQNWSGGVGWTGFGSGTIANLPGWQHMSVSVAAYPHLANQIVLALDANQYGAAPHAGTCSYWIDNLQLTTPPLPKPTLNALVPAAANGLTLLPTGTSQYSRIMVYPGGSSGGTDYSWYNKTFPVTYEFSFNGFPKVNDYAANLFIVPISSLPWGTGDTAIDWNCPEGVFLNFTANTSNPATNWNIGLTAKTNNGGGNPPITLTNYNYTKSPNGSWKLKFTSNTHCQIITPDGTPTDVDIPADMIKQIVNDVDPGNPQATAGNTAAMAYFGIMNRELSNIGVPAVMNHIGITNGTSADINDSFATLDTTWAKLQGTAFDITLQTGDQFMYASWNTPNDAGFTALQAAASLTGPWKDIAGPAAWAYIQPGATTMEHQTLLTHSALNAAFAGAEAQGCYFRLIKRQYTKLQVLFPGEVNAPDTVSGKTGTPLPVTSGAVTTFTVNACDATWHVVNANDVLDLTSTDGGITWGGTGTYTLSGGTVQPQAIFDAPGTYTVTAADHDKPAITPDTSASVTAN